VRESWDRRISRAVQLAAEGGAAASLLNFYARLLQAQKELYQALGRTARPRGSPKGDWPLIRRPALTLLQAVAEHGPPPLAAEAQTLMESTPGAMGDLLCAYWTCSSDRQFFAKAILQPYAQWLAEAGITAADRSYTPAENRCPKCGGIAQLSILEASSAVSAGGSGRLLLCATCLTSWPFRRIRCPWCGEDDERKLGYFESPAFDYQRVDACDTCRRYLKSIDLGRLGFAVPLVDEVAGASLDLSAREHGYEKIELNLVGL
jgi:formate dehydrogenase maturation protein FdhE